MNKCFKCGTEFEGNFCPNCGTKHNASKNSMQKIGKLLNLLPIALFLLFSALNWVFMACKVASLGISWGNVYVMVNDYEFHSSATALVVFSVLSCAVAIAFLLAHGLRKRKTEFIVCIISYVMYFCVMVSAATLLGAVNKDGLQAESATKLLISFSVIFAALAVGAIVGNSLLTKRNPKYAQAVAEDCVQPTFTQKVASKANTYYKSHTKKVNVIASAVLVVVLILVLVIPITTSKFNVDKIEKVNFGDDKATVEKLLGKADTETEYTWTYYGKYYKNLVDKQQTLQKWDGGLDDDYDDVDSMFGDAFGALENLFAAEMKLSEIAEIITDKVLTISFNSDGNVSEVTFDTKVNSEEEKELQKVVQMEVRMQISNNWSALVSYVKLYYTDGSYKLTKDTDDPQLSPYIRNYDKSHEIDIVFAFQLSLMCLCAIEFALAVVLAWRQKKLGNVCSLEKLWALFAAILTVIGIICVSIVMVAYPNAEQLLAARRQVGLIAIYAVMHLAGLVLTVARLKHYKKVGIEDKAVKILGKVMLASFIISFAITVGYFALLLYIKSVII